MPILGKHNSEVESTLCKPKNNITELSKSLQLQLLQKKSTFIKLAQMSEKPENLTPSQHDKVFYQWLLPVSEKTIWEWSRDGRFPKPIRLGGAGGKVTVWRASDVQKWIEQRASD